MTSQRSANLFSLLREVSFIGHSSAGESSRISWDTRLISSRSNLYLFLVGTSL